ncbi:hypothetical protein CKAH01_14675 [Colletotrichum kahawae]|uniref:Uncharacterized protein n=1 Tax=Colletotrichum kahawae TaxID=34407 RepID=A0AAD9YMA5_COLKA|nr:hypothetical protein CKAH01_14675 [Colletotrichum kahawae]
MDDMSCPPASVTTSEKAKDNSNRRTPQSLRACVTTPASSAQGPAVTHERGSNWSGGWGPKPCLDEGAPGTLTQTRMERTPNISLITPVSDSRGSRTPERGPEKRERPGDQPHGTWEPSSFHLAATRVDSLRRRRLHPAWP